MLRLHADEFLCSGAEQRGQFGRGAHVNELKLMRKG